MSVSVRCDNPEPHYFHEYTKVVIVECSGKSRCGRGDHQPHGFEETQKLWCEGICDCRMRGAEVHGPGAHK